jgi:tetratricopeptide (TPR) repeat protein
MTQGKRWLIRSKRNTTGGRTPLAGLLLIFAALLPRECGGAEDEALRHLLLGNELAGLGRHVEAISAWRVAAQMRPDSNVPLNNMANSYLGLEQLDDALREAQEAFRRKTDYMTSVTCKSATRAAACRLSCGGMPTG